MSTCAHVHNSFGRERVNDSGGEGEHTLLIMISNTIYDAREPERNGEDAIF